MTVNLDCLIFFDCFSKRAHLRRPGQLIRSTRGADQGSVDRQDHGRESCVSRHARAGPLARRASTLARGWTEGKCWDIQIDDISGAEREFNQQGDYLFINDSKNGLIEPHLRQEEHCPIEKSSARDSRPISCCHRSRFCGLDLADLLILGNPDSGRQLITALRRFCLSTAFASGISLRR
jgi:hypothetical protein